MATLPEIPDRAPHIERAIVKALEEERAKSAKAPFLSMSEIGGCERNLWAGLHGIPEESDPDPLRLGIFRLGNTLEAHVVELLRLSGRQVIDRDPKTGEQFHYVDFDARLRGRLDGFIEIGTDRRRLAVLEVKSANTAQFELASELGIKAWRPTYFDQAQMYMGYSKHDEALVVVIGKETGRVYAERIRFDAERFHALRLKAGRVLDGEQPSRPEAASSQYCSFCKWCRRNEWCWSAVADARFDP